MLGRYSNPDNATRLSRVLSGHGRDRPSRRPIPSVRQKQTRLTDSQRSEVVRRYAAGESSNALAAEFGIDRRTATAIIRRAGAEVRYRADVDLDAAGELYQSGLSLARVRRGTRCVGWGGPQLAPSRSGSRLDALGRINGASGQLRRRHADRHESGCHIARGSGHYVRVSDARGWVLCEPAKAATDRRIGTASSGRASSRVRESCGASNGTSGTPFTAS